VTEPVMRVEDLRKEFHSHGTVVRAVDGVSFEVAPGETLALVGESGCGKSTTARCIVRLIDPTGGRVLFRGDDIAAMPARRFRALRRHIQMVFQDPHASLNPSMTVRQTLREPLRLHGDDGDASDARLRELMERVRLDPALLERRPDQLSGGQKQRVGIGCAIATRPAFVVLDEPTSALDMSLRVTLLSLLAELQRELGMAYLFISHDISTVRQIADRVVVMYAGRVVESGTVDEVLDAPRRDYTKALIAAIPVPDPERRGRARGAAPPEAARRPEAAR
jgi:ABC-type glutathione transport system ATPase component